LAAWPWKQSEHKLSGSFGVLGKKDKLFHFRNGKLNVSCVNSL
jgi:hypothetical protein